MKLKLLLGPPGTGKTTKLLSILEQELMKVDSEKIAYVSYTRKGAYEGRDRAREKMGLEIKNLPYFKTLHSIAYRDLGMQRGDLLEDNKELIKEFSDRMGMNFKGYYTEDFQHNDDRYLFFDFLHRNNPKTAERYTMDMNMDILKWVRNNYRRFKEAVRLPDYTDLIERFIKKGKSLPVEVAIIDEAQDLTNLQWKMIWIAFANCKRIYIAGDDDQAIYEWSGADIEFFLNITAETEVLSKSYRLPLPVYNYAQKVASHIGTRIPKEFTPNDKEGSVKHVMSFKESDIDNGESWLFLARNNYHLKQIEEWLKDEGKVYYLKDKLSTSPSIIKAINKHALVCKGKHKEGSSDIQMVNFFCKEPAKFDRPWYEEMTKLKPETIKYYRRIIGANTDTQDTKIKVSTIHGIKGGEADNVVLLTDINKAVHRNFSENNDAEMRVYYVGVTRAIKNLFIVTPTNKYHLPIFEIEEECFE